MTPLTTMRATLTTMVLLAAVVTGQDVAAPPPLSLRGYDVVAYFTDGRAMKGLPALWQDWDGRRYQFSSQRHKALFAADPDRYTPQFAGLCAIGIGMGYKIEADPTIWKIIDGKLFVFSSPAAKKAAESDPSTLSRSYEKWRTSN